MDTKERLTADLKSAMLARDTETAETLRGLKSAILYEEVALKKRETGLSNEEVVSVLKREAKKRKDAITLYLQGGNDTSAKKEQVELEIIQQYLPETLSEEATRELVEKALQDLNIETPQRSDTGKIIGYIKQKAGSASDPSVIAKIVNEKIG